jgi:DNA-binding MarR family transcriptional regulator
MSALSVLVFGGPRTLGQLATIEQVKPPTMTRLVTALEEDGFVRREADRQDGRLTMIHATAKGEKAMAAGRSRRVLAIASRLKKMPPAQVKELERAAELIAGLARSE